jgi:putative sterol carrier protein
MSDLTPSLIFSDKIPAKIASAPDKVRAINAVYQFNISGDSGGEWVLDLTKDSDQISEGTSDEAKCTVSMKDTDFVSLWSGKLNAQMAFMTGKLKVKGDMSLAMKLTQVIG